MSCVLDICLGTGLAWPRRWLVLSLENLLIRGKAERQPGYRFYTDHDGLRWFYTMSLTSPLFLLYFFLVFSKPCANCWCVKLWSLPLSPLYLSKLQGWPYYGHRKHHNPVKSMSPSLKKGIMLISCWNKCCCGSHLSVTAPVILDGAGLRWDKRKGEKTQVSLSVAFQGPSQALVSTVDILPHMTLC